MREFHRCRRRCRPSRLSRHGVTLVELLASMAIVAALAGAAFPSMRHWLAWHEVSRAADLLAASVEMARTVAVARRSAVSLMPLREGEALDAGWQLVLEQGEPEPASGAELGMPARRVISTVNLDSRCLRIVLRGSPGAANTLRLTAVGYSRSEPGGFFAATFILSCESVQRQVRLGAQGRVRVCTPGRDADCDNATELAALPPAPRAAGAAPGARTAVHETRSTTAEPAEIRSSMFSDTDHAAMQQALALAARGMFTTTPNPRVGCVLSKGGQVIGQGFTQPAGHDHAEIQALKDAVARGFSPTGATAYVTLEPCSHFGRTPPCADALARAGITRVVAAMEDPNPSVSGRGLQRLRDAGIDVRCGLLEKEARDLNIGFVSRMTRGRPWVRVKVAASLDGGTALHDGTSQWITGQAARDDGHVWRARACAILTGIGTVRDDDPQLTVRAVDTPRQPQRVLVDSRLEVPLDARLLTPDSGDFAKPVLVFCAIDNAARRRALEARGAEIVVLPNPHGKVELGLMLEELGRRGINELHVEAGFKLNGSLIREHCADELLVYLAPKLLGDAQGMFKLPPLGSLQEAPAFHWHDVRQIGDDLRVIARRSDAV